MPEIRSSLGRTSTSAPPTRTFTVEDRSQGFEIPQNAQRMSGEYYPEPGEQVVNPNVAHMYAQQAPQVKELSVDEWKAMRNLDNGQQQAGLSDDARRRIDLLLGIGQVTREVVVLHKSKQVTFSIRSLKAKEKRHIVMLARQFDQSKSSDDFFVLRNTTLLYSVFAIDGFDIDLVLGISGFEPKVKIEYRNAFLSDLDDDLLNHLFVQYNELIVAEESRFSVTTSQQVKEVVQDLKKSR